MDIKSFSAKMQPIIENKLKRKTKIIEATGINGIRRYKLMVMDPESNASPLLCLEPYFERFRKNGNMGEVLSALLQDYHDGCLKKPFDTESFTDFSQVRENIFYRLINYGANRKFLEGTPHSRFLDLAKIYCVKCTVNDTLPAHIRIHDSHLGMWGITAEELEWLAESNTPRLLSPSFFPLGCLMPEDAGLPGTAEGCVADIAGIMSDMYVLTNSQRVNGAAAICYDGPLGKFSEKNDADTIILPSSIHETILLPLARTDALSGLKQMVREINETTVSPVDWLSDNIYIYRKATGLIEIA